MQVRIMAVDDEPDILRIVEISLAKWGYTVDAFTDPVAALDHFRANASEYSLILTDIKMPGMSGAELAKRAKKIRPDIKVMVMTAFEVDRDLRKALPSIERHGFLQKPFHTADVCVAVKRHLTAA
jgi:CheY-like chemotaxis protein